MTMYGQVKMIGVKVTPMTMGPKTASAPSAVAAVMLGVERRRRIDRKAKAPNYIIAPSSRYSMKSSA